MLHKFHYSNWTISSSWLPIIIINAPNAYPINALPSHPNSIACHYHHHPQPHTTYRHFSITMIINIIIISFAVIVVSAFEFAMCYVGLASSQSNELDYRHSPSPCAPSSSSSRIIVLCCLWPKVDPFEYHRTSVCRRHRCALHLSTLNTDCP